MTAALRGLLYQAFGLLHNMGEDQSLKDRNFVLQIYIVFESCVIRAHLVHGVNIPDRNNVQKPFRLGVILIRQIELRKDREFGVFT